MNRMKRLTGRKILLATVALCAFGIAKAQNAQAAKDTLTLTLDKALTIALDENPTMKVAAEEIALKKVAGKEAWQSLLPEASIAGSLDHTIKAAEMKLNDMSFKMGQDGTNTANAGLSINLPLFAPAVYRTMSMTKTDIELAVEKSRASKLDLVNQVTKAYYQLMLSQDSYEVLQKSYELAEENYHIVNAKYQQGAVSEFDKITAEVQMRSVKPSVISAGNAVTLSKLQLKVLMGVTADVEIKIDDSLAAYESIVFANQLENDIPVENLYGMAVAVAVKAMNYHAGQETWALMPLSTVSPAKLTSTFIKKLEAANFNYVVTAASKNVTQGGKTGGGEWIDVIRFRDWLQNDMRLRVVNLLIINPKISYLDNGIGLVENQMLASLKDGQKYGGISPTEYDEDGKAIPGYTTSVPLAADLTSAQKASRVLKDCKFSARLAGAIHMTEIKGNLTYEKL